MFLFVETWRSLPSNGSKPLNAPFAGDVVICWGNIEVGTAIPRIVKVCWVRKINLLVEYNLPKLI